MLETWNLVRKCRYICSFKKYTFLLQDSLNFAYGSIFFCNKSTFLLKIVPLLKAVVWLLKVFLFFYFQLLLDKRLLLIKNISLVDFSKSALNWKNGNDDTIFWHESLSIFFDIAVFFLSILVTGPSFMWISLLVLELWQISFIRDWPEIWKSEIPLSDFCLISGDWSKLGIPNLARMSLINVKPAKC